MFRVASAHHEPGGLKVRHNPVHRLRGGTNHLTLAFVADGFAENGEEITGAYVYSEGDKVVGEVYGDADPEVVSRQVERVLSLDADGRGFPEVRERDPVVGMLQARYPGLRPVLEVRGEREHAFPGPSRLMEFEEFPGLTRQKIERLKHLAPAALEGKLEADGLRSLPVEEAISRLREVPGIGDFSAELVLLCGAGKPDWLPTYDPRLGCAVAIAYGLKTPPTVEELEETAENWRHYRTWVVLYLRAMLEEETREIARGSGRSAMRAA